MTRRSYAIPSAILFTTQWNEYKNKEPFQNRMKLALYALVLLLVTLVASQDTTPLVNNDELESFLRQVEFSTSDLDAQDAIETVMDSYLDLMSDYESDSVRLEQDLIGAIESYYGDSSETAAHFVDFVKELRRQTQADLDDLVE